MKTLEEYNGNRNEEGLKLYEIKRKNKRNQTNNIVSFPIKIFVLYHNTNKEQILDMESKLANKSLEFENNLANVKSNSNRKLKLLRYFDYIVVILSKKCLEDYTLMEVLADNFVIGKNGKNKKIIPIIIEQDIYEPETRAQIIKWWIDRYNDYEKNFFRGKYGDDISKTLEKMQQIIEMLKMFLVFSKDKDIKSDEEPYSRLIKKIEEYSGVIHERSGVLVNNNYNYNQCQIINAEDDSTVNATQNNGISKDELKSIVDLIENNLEKLNQEQAEDLKDTLSMVVEEFNTGTPRVGRLRKCLTLLAPMITVTNGIPILTENLQKVYDYILPFIN